MNNIDLIVVLISIIVIGLSYFKRFDSISIIILFFFSGALFYLPAMIFLFSDNYELALKSVHIKGLGYFFEFLSLISIAIFTIILFRSAYRLRIAAESFDKKLFIFIAISAFSVLVAFLNNYNHTFALNSQPFKHFLGLEFFLINTLIMHFSLLRSKLLVDRNIKLIFFVCVAIYAFIFFIELYEVLSSKAWAGTDQFDGVHVYRASGTLFNPNLLAFFLGLSIIFSSVFYEKKLKFLSLLIMALCSFSMYLTGSRTAFYLILFALLAKVIILRDKLRLEFLLLFLLLFNLPFLIGYLFRIDNFISLGYRFYYGIYYAIEYGLVHLGLKDLVLPNEVNISILGRFLGEEKDSGWIVILDELGTLGFFPFFIGFMICTKFFINSIRTKAFRYSLSAYISLVYCVLYGLSMKFQLYPACLFISIAMVVFLRTIRNIKPIRFLKE